MATAVTFGHMNSGLEAGVINGPVNFYAKGMRNTRDTVDRFISKLRTSDPQYEKARIERLKGGLLGDLYRWVLDNEDFQRWHGNVTSRRLLWIRGDPGKGKTMLLCGIINDLEHNQNGEAGLIGYFFCQATDSRLNSATAVLRGLIFCLLNQSETLAESICQKYGERDMQWFQKSEPNSFDFFKKMLLRIIEEPDMQETCLIIDALDECVSQREELLGLIHHLSSLRVKLLISSRNWPTIEGHLNLIDQKITLRLELNADSIANAVEKYIDHQVNIIAVTKSCDKTMQDSIRGYMRRNSDNTFLWVALVCSEIHKSRVRRWQVLKELEEFPPGLDDLYQQMANQVLSDNNATIYRQVLALLLVAYRPMSIGELRYYVESPNDFPDNEQDLREIVDLCGSFLNLRENIIYFVHQSARDYLSQRIPNKILTGSLEEGHSTITSRCISTMAKILKRNIYSLPTIGFTIDEVVPIKPDPLGPAGYACVYWIDHMAESIGIDTPHPRSHLGLSHNFLREHFLHWLEALSLLHEIPAGIIAISKLRDLVSGSSDSQASAGLGHSQKADYTRLVGDAERFIKNHKGGFEKVPLEVYSSALISSPTQSIIRELFQREVPKWIKALPKVWCEWNEWLQILEGHDDAVRSIAFSPDGKRLVSGSSDTKIKLWNIATGVCQKTLEVGKDLIFSVAFSIDGRFFASGQKSSLNLWETATGAHQREFVGHRDWIGSVAFLLDGEQIASGSADGTVKLWDIATGLCLKTIEGHSGTIWSIDISPNGMQLLSGSHDKTIKLWDIVTGRCQLIIKGQGWEPRSVVFSPNGKQIASGSYDHTIKLWDLATGQCLRTFEGHSYGVFSVAFSPAGEWIASASDDRTVKIWDLTTGKCLKTLNQIGGARLVAFSPDGKQLASAAGNGVIQLWDTVIKDRQKPFQDQSNRIGRTILSPDRKLFASASKNQCIYFWDTETAECCGTLQDSSDKIRLIGFSTNGKLFASASGNETIKLWNIATRECYGILHTDKMNIQSVAFSPDGKLFAWAQDTTITLWNSTTSEYQSFDSQDYTSGSVAISPNGKQMASGSYIGTIQLWVIATGVCQKTFKCHCYSLSALAFSPDGKQLISWGTDARIKLWDLVTGCCEKTFDLGLGSRGIPGIYQISYLSSGTELIFDLSAFGGTNSCWSGVFSLSSESVQDSTFSITGPWIMRGGQKILWLPPDYRPMGCAIRGSTITISCYLGLLITMRFAEDEIDMLLNRHA